MRCSVPLPPPVGVEPGSIAAPCGAIGVERARPLWDSARPGLNQVHTLARSAALRPTAILALAARAPPPPPANSCVFHARDAAPRGWARNLSWLPRSGGCQLHSRRERWDRG